MMKDFFKLIAPLSMLFFCFASVVFGAPKSNDPKLDEAIAKANSEWVAAMKTGDAAAIAAPYAVDAIFVGADGVCTKGRAEIEKLYITRFQKAGLAVSTKIDSRNVTVDGDLAYESGYGEIGINKDGKTAIGGGRYLTVWQRQTEGWKIIRNIVLP
jgi:uncharacterized protein (TIGR02246 family)